MKYSLISLAAVHLTLLAAPCFAQEGADCSSNDDCAQGFECVNFASSGTSSGGRADRPEPAPPDLERLTNVSSALQPAGAPEDAGVAPEEEPSEPTGECYPLECESDDDCGEGYVCDFGDGSVSAVDCAPGGDCTERDIQRIGYCGAAPLLCEEDADCPEPAQCGEHGECEFVLEACDSDDECAVNYECLVVDQSTDCWAPDNVPDDVDPEQLMEAEDGLLCLDRRFAFCFPPPTPCESADECHEGWVCEEVQPGGPPSWEDLEQSCMPPAVELLMNGNIDVNEESLEELAGVDIDEGDSSSGGTAVAPVRGGGAPSSDPGVVEEDGAQAQSTSAEAVDDAASDSDDEASDGDDREESDDAHSAAESDAEASDADGDDATDADETDETRTRGVDDGGSNDDGCGISAGSRSASPWWLSALALLVLRRRRR